MVDSKSAAANFSRADAESNFVASTDTTAVILSGSVLISTTPGSVASASFTCDAQPIHVIPGILSDTKVTSAPAGLDIDKSDAEVLLGALRPGAVLAGAGVHPAASTTSNAGNQRDFIVCSCVVRGKSEL